VRETTRDVLNERIITTEGPMAFCPKETLSRVLLKKKNWCGWEYLTERWAIL
jgi:hypothetical protein